MTRRIAHRTRGQGHGPIVRLMSPSDLGEELKPFVFLDLFEADMRALAGSMPVHPHSGIATVTVFADGDVTFDDPQAGHGILGYGGVEWARAGRGMWHGKELSAGTSPTVQGFQLWLALPPALEHAESEAQYIGDDHMPRIGPARLIVGAYQDATSPVRAPDGINYLLVTLKPGERWTYTPPAGHVIAWVAVSKGALTAGEPVPVERDADDVRGRGRRRCHVRGRVGHPACPSASPRFVLGPHVSRGFGGGRTSHPLAQATARRDR